eukprot:TRINITY_DN4072_c0_g4_i1.p1 TRINITY_DN4072_c0_g4~~TRINITY_DN4072_c0_g4_i1.p1  ORF type:complete len:406 (+),score=112.90 TRINITY_DN4072_c0_g4_i1:105-1220(+)
MPQRRFGKYEIQSNMQSGPASSVRLVVDTEDQTRWACKIIDKSRSWGEEEARHYQQQIAAMKRLQHRNVVQLREVLQTDKHLYVVMELCAGGDLFDRIVSEQKLSEDVARRYFQQLICGLEHCHAQGVVHRDLRPESLLLGQDGMLKIGSFSFAATPDGAQLDEACGSPGYVAPEVLSGAYTGFPADVWSAGIVLFAMLAGYLPFDDTSMAEQFRKIKKCEYEMPEHFPDGAKDLLSRILVADPKQRSTLEGVIAHPWFRTDLDESMFKLAVLLIGGQEVLSDKMHHPLSDVGISAECAVELLCVPRQGIDAEAPRADCGGCGIAIYCSAPTLGASETVCVELPPDATVADLATVAAARLGLQPREGGQGQ